ncbi:Mov34-domain-containing protein [Ephemerocybe angulata]|nr:Mov34-domain-containing protein [Tulosesus angulatus]
MLPPASAPAFQPRPQSDWSYATPPAQPPLHPFPASSIQYPAYPGPTRPQPPVPGPPPPASAPAAPPPPPPILTTSTPKTAPDAAPGLKQVTLPRECLPRFIAIAKVNTNLNKETCGLLLGVDKGHKFVVTTLLIPKQSATSDTCTMDEEELVLQFTEERGLITLGWIHTHPSQSCFMSSVDLHTHSGFQCMLPESFAVVCAPKSTPNFGIFRLTDPPGLQTILHCNAKEAFHPHPDVPIYTDADKGHVHMKSGSLEIVDLR